MKIELRKDFTYSLIVPTSMGVRITPANGQPVHSSETFTMQATSAETNVASISSYLGLPVKVLTTFVKDSPIAGFIKSNLASRHMSYAARGVIAISSISPTAATAHGDREFRMTAPEKSDAH